MDRLILTLAVLIMAVGIGAFYYFGDKPDLIRVGSLLGAAVVAAAVALQSAHGRAAWEFAKSSRVELRKVVWPTNKEAVQVTGVVLILVVLIAIFLWLLDLGLLQLVEFLTGQRF